MNIILLRQWNYRGSEHILTLGIKTREGREEIKMKMDSSQIQKAAQWARLCVKEWKVGDGRWASSVVYWDKKRANILYCVLNNCANLTTYIRLIINQS